MRWRLTHLFQEAMSGRGRVLPRGILHRYLESKLEEREVLLESVSRFGSPQYFFDEPALASIVQRFHQAFSRHFKRFRAFYAMKSNAFPGVCQHVIGAGMGLDVSSGLELSAALALGCQDIVFSGPGKTDEELRLAVVNGHRVTVLMDSAHELERLAGLSKTLQPGAGDIRVGVRIRGEHHGIWNKFGVPLQELASIIGRALGLKGIRPSGIQFHTSWNLDSRAQVRMIERVGEHVQERLPGNMRDTLRFLDIGGGYWPEQGEWLNPENTVKGRLIRLLDPDFRFRALHYYRASQPLEDRVGEISRAIRRQGPPISQLEIWTEPGRWISHPAMHILLKVIDRKGSRVAITDGGTNMLGWERPLTEFIPVLNLSQPSHRRVPCMVFGALCTPHDVWGTSFFGEGIEPGDVLMIPDQGAYTYSLRQSFIKPRARVVRYDGGGLEEVEREESCPP